MDDSPREVEILRTAGGVNAESIVAALRGHGIPARAHGEAIGAVLALTVDGLGEVAILVPEEFAAQARDLLADGEQGRLELKETDTDADAGPGLQNR
jgi:Putative prokaryotic signal transducing protein